MSQPLSLSYLDAGFGVDVARSGITADDIRTMRPRFAEVHEAMCAIEQGAIKNPDENRKVTHFTDRMTYRETDVFRDVTTFFDELRNGVHAFDAVVLNGIGGSALGPQLLQWALRGPYWNELSKEQRGGSPRIYFLDNTDPGGVVDVLATIELSTTLVITISKSGSTREPLNNMLAFEAAYADAGLDFAAHAGAVTMPGSKLDEHAKSQGWLRRWPMAESIGGRTSVTAIVGHVPAAAAGIDFASFIDGACTMDEWTRVDDVFANPAYLLAAVWYLIGNGQGDRNMVIVPYSDRLVLLSRYLQQLVMESLGKELDLAGNVVNQGLTVYGNKGGTDAHAYIQQLNDGRDDFFVTFVEVLADAESLMMDGELSMGDYLHNFMQGLSNALHSKGRRVIQLTLENLDARSLGMLIALYERAVAAYAELIGINAFHQPGVQAYKKASDALNEASKKLLTFISQNTGFTGSATAFRDAIDPSLSVADIAGILAKFAVNRRVIEGASLTRELVDGAWTYHVTNALAT